MSDEKTKAGGHGAIYSDPLTLLLYKLMNDHVTVGTMEELVSIAVEVDDVRVFPNGWLARYANELSERLKSAKTDKLSDTISKLFNDDDGDEEYDLAPDRPSFGSAKEEIAEELELVRDEIEEAAERISLIEKAKKEDKEADPITNEDAKTMVDDLVKQGLLTDDQANTIEQDLDDLVKDVTEE